MLYKFVLVSVLTFGPTSAAMAAGTESSSVPKASQPTVYEQGVQAVESGAYGRALPLLNKVVRSEPDHADAWNYIGFSHRQLKAFDDALAAYQKALAIDRNHRGANEYLGELYLMMGDVAKAKERLQQLDKACFFGCKEYDELKAAIKAHESG